MMMVVVIAYSHMLVVAKGGKDTKKEKKSH